MKAHETDKTKLTFMCAGGYKGEMLGAGFEQSCFGADVSLSDVFENVGRQRPTATLAAHLPVTKVKRSNTDTSSACDDLDIGGALARGTRG